jgi:hypothetical protein
MNVADHVTDGDSPSRCRQVTSSVMIRRCLRMATKLGIRLGVATGIGFGIYRLIESRRAKPTTDDESPLPRPATVSAPTPGSPSALGAVEPGPPDPPLVEPEMLTSVKGRNTREPIASVGFGSGSEANGSSNAGPAPAPTSAQPAPADKAPATKKAVPAKKPSAAAGKPPPKPKRTTGDTGPKMPPDRKPGKGQE